MLLDNNSYATNCLNSYVANCLLHSSKTTCIKNELQNANISQRATIKNTHTHLNDYVLFPSIVKLLALINIEDYAYNLKTDVSIHIGAGYIHITIQMYDTKTLRHIDT